MFLEQQISILDDFWRSFDSEDWSNDAEQFSFDHRNKLHFKIYSDKLFYCKL